MSWLFWVRRLLNTTHATPCCEKKIVRRSSGGGWGESVSIALKVGVSENKAEILALSSISKIVQCNLTSYLVSYIIRPEYLVSQTCKTPVLGDITTLWLNISPFQWRFNMSLCDITWHGDILFNKVCNLSKIWSFTSLSVTKTAKSDHPSIRRKRICFMFTLKDYKALFQQTSTFKAI